MELISGQKLPLKNLFEQQQFRLRVQFNTSHHLDLSCFALDQHDRLIHDDYMVFYNQPSSPNKEVCYSQAASIHEFQIDLAKTNPNTVSRLVFCATLDNPQLSMPDIQSGVVELINAKSEVVASYRLLGTSFRQEKALMLIEIYFKNDLWRLAAIGQGFSGGLQALVEHFGAEVSATPSPVEPTSVFKVDLRKKAILDKVQADAPHLLDLTKKSLISLEKNQLIGVRARVALVLDYSGSMLGQYRRGDVQKVVNRLMPLAIHFDDDGSFECWAFAQKTTQLDDVTLNNVNDFINTTQRGWKNWQVGARYNEEIPAIEAVIDYYQRFKDKTPTYVLFISDGGVGNRRQMQKVLTKAAELPIFWQFVGVDGRDYGALEKLDEMSGRIVDNCNFFSLDRIESVSDERLYELLLEEFPDWLKVAQQKNIVQN